MTQRIAPPGAMEALVRAQRRRWSGRAARQMALLLGVDIPSQVQIGRDFRLQHRGRGVVIHPRTVIGERVQIFHNVTVGRSEPHSLLPDDAIEGFLIDDDAWLCVGAVVLGSHGLIRIGRGTVIAANSVVTRSTGDYEVWAGVPARKIKDREPPLRNE